MVIFTVLNLSLDNDRGFWSLRLKYFSEDWEHRHESVINNAWKERAGIPKAPLAQQSQCPVESDHLEGWGMAPCLLPVPSHCSPAGPVLSWTLSMTKYTDTDIHAHSHTYTGTHSFVHVVPISVMSSPKLPKSYYSMPRWNPASPGVFPKNFCPNLFSLNCYSTESPHCILCHFNLLFSTLGLSKSDLPNKNPWG